MKIMKNILMAVLCAAYGWTVVFGIEAILCSCTEWYNPNRIAVVSVAAAGAVIELMNYIMIKILLRKVGDENIKKVIDAGCETLVRLLKGEEL